jgi:quinol monooxygenase YgiN
MTYGLFGGFRVQPGQRDQLESLLLEAATLLGDNPACLVYAVGTSDEPDVVWVNEIWVDREAHAASLDPDDVRALIQRARPLISGTVRRTEFTVSGGIGTAAP